MRKQLARHHGDRTKSVYTLGFDELERLDRVPLVHQHESVTGECPRLKRAIIRSHMEEWRGNE